MPTIVATNVYVNVQQLKIILILLLPVVNLYSKILSLLI